MITGCSGPGCGAELDTAAGGSVQVVAEAADVAEAVAAVRLHAPDVVLLDVHLPGGGGIGVLREVLGAGERRDSWRCRCPTLPRM